MTHNIVVHAALHARVRSHSRTLTHLPLFHVAGLYAVSTPQFHRYGGAVVVMRQWDTQACLRHLQDPALAITHVVGVPTHYLLLSQLPEFATAEFPTLEVSAVGGAPVPLPLLETWARKGCHLSLSFGMTEAIFSRTRVTVPESLTSCVPTVDALVAVKLPSGWSRRPTPSCSAHARRAGSTPSSTSPA